VIKHGILSTYKQKIHTLYSDDSFKALVEKMQKDVLDSVEKHIELEIQKVSIAILNDTTYLIDDNRITNTCTQPWRLDVK
jgi:hypothetical protein